MALAHGYPIMKLGKVIANGHPFDFEIVSISIICPASVTEFDR